MASVFLTAELLGRQRSAPVSLLLAVTLMISAGPQIISDASFQLSVMAMVGLIFVAPPLQFLCKRKIEAALPSGFAGFLFPIADSLAVSLGSVTAVWPLISLYFGIVSWVGPLATLLTVAAMPAIIVAGSLCAALGILVLPLAQAIAWIVWLFLSYVLMVIKIADYVPSSQVKLFPYLWIFAYYAILALLLLTYNRRVELPGISKKLGNFVLRLPLKGITATLSISAVIIFAIAGTIPDKNLHVAFMDVGQGDAILISRGSQQILIDGGPSGEAIALQLSRQMPFWDRTIDLVISTHPHADHLSGLFEVLKRYHVNLVLFADNDYDAPLAGQWQTAISQKNIRSIQAQAGQIISFGDAQLQVLNPQSPFLFDTDSDVDNNAVITRLSIGKVSFLFMADARRETEQHLIQQRLLQQCNVLKVGHHGSATSTTDSFLAVTSPGAAVISVGKDNEFGHPDKQVVRRLVEKIGNSSIYRTDQQGTIEFISDGNHLWVTADK